MGLDVARALVVMGVVAIERAPTLPVTVAVTCTVMYGSAISQAFAMDRAATTTLAILLVPMMVTAIVFAPFRAFAVEGPETEGVRLPS